MAGGLKVQNPAKPTAQANAAQAQAAGAAPKVVGPNIWGNLEEYQLVRHLQSALFGGVYEAKGISSGRDFAIKVLHKSELVKAQETNSIEFCEVPLSEIRFAELMKGDEHVMEPVEHFEDAHCHYVVFDLCRGGDLLEALKQKPHGFDEQHAQFLIRQAAKGLAFLHKRCVAMQDVSLENMLLNVNESTGCYQVKICDPGQAVIFETDQNGKELQVNFRGLVGKSFRPPELHEQRPYQATKVDSWCLGWSTFYLLTAQPLFMSADPAQQDADWLLFQKGDYTTLFQQKSNLCSNLSFDFIVRLMQLDSSRRMSIADCLEHPWLADPKIAPILAPKELLPEPQSQGAAGGRQELELPTQNKELEQQTIPGSQGCRVNGGPGPIVSRAADVTAGSAKAAGSVVAIGGQVAVAGGSSMSTTGSIHHIANSSSDLPTWTTASPYASTHSPLSRVRSPMRGPCPANTTSSVQLAMDRRGGQPRQPGAATRNPYVMATAHSPPPTVNQMAARVLQRAGPRTTSPLHSSPDLGNRGTIGLQHQPVSLGPSPVANPRPTQDPPRPAFLTPRSDLRLFGVNVESQEGEDVQPSDRAWTFKSGEGNISIPLDGDTALDAHGRSRALSPATMPNIMRIAPGAHYPVPSGQGRHTAHSPTRSQNIYVPRSPSPLQGVSSIGSIGSAAISARQVTQIRAPSPVAGVPRNSGGFSWAQAPPTYSPRGASPRAASPVGPAGAGGFAWSPDPPSPRTYQRTMSPLPYNAIVFPQVAAGMHVAQTRRSGRA